MKNEEIIIAFLKNNNGYITTKDFLNFKITKPTINTYINSGLIRRVTQGIYIDNSLINDEYFIIQKKHPFAIFSYNTAFHILNLTNRIPYEISVTVPRGKTIRGNYKIHYVSNKYYDVGITEVLSPCGNLVKAYNAERCICDMIKSDNEFDLELQNRILDNYFKSENKDIDKLIEYSKIFNIYDKINAILGVMMKW